MKYAVIGARLLLGLVFTVFGLSGFLDAIGSHGFIHGPAPSGDAGTMAGILMSSHWMVVVKICEISGGVLVLTGLNVPMGLTFLTPVLVNILCFHAFLEPSGLPMALILIALDGFLISQNWGAFRGIVSRG